MEKLVRALLLLTAAALALCGMWGGLVRAALPWPPVNPQFAGQHGALMLSGFLGTLIGVERAVALGKPWAWSGPVLTGLGSLALAFTGRTSEAWLMICGGSAFMVLVLTYGLKLQLSLPLGLMTLGALCWLGGNITVFLEGGVHQALIFWQAFPLLTIAAERLELNRLVKVPAYARWILTAGCLCLLFCAGAGFKNYDLSVRLSGLIFLGLSVWFLRYDIARFTVRKEGVIRFIAVSLLAGYFWLGISGLVALWQGAMFTGFLYDAWLHAFFAGFIMSMIFGHAPIVIPAVLQKKFTFYRGLYISLVLLHLSLLVRVAGDLSEALIWRQWGAVSNFASIILFALMIPAGILRKETGRSNEN